MAMAMATVRGAMPPWTRPDSESAGVERLRRESMLSLAPLAGVRRPMTRSEMK
jgi:hypothetical protein